MLTRPDGSVIEGSSEVTRRVQELLRLDYRQFKQLSMIAQGEFARLLSAPSGEKTRIFREIFGTDLYDRMAAALKGKASGAYRQVMDEGGMILEVVYTQVLRNCGIKVSNFPRYPRIVGMSGSGGLIYGYTEWKCKIKDLLSQFNFYKVKES